MPTQPPEHFIDPDTEPLQVGDFCHSATFNTDHPLFVRLMQIAGKITDIGDGKFHIRLLTGEEVMLPEDESCITKCSTEDFISQAGYLLEVQKMEYQRLLGEIHEAHKNIRYAIPGAPNEVEFDQLKAKKDESSQNIEELKGIYQELGIFGNFQEILS